MTQGGVIVPDLGLEQDNEENSSTSLTAKSNSDGSFGGSYVLGVWAETLAGPINGIEAYGQAGSAGVFGASHVGVVGQGGSIGVIGRVDNPSTLPYPFENAGVYGTSFGDRESAGVLGENDVGYGVYATSDIGIAVRGDSEEGPGVLGESGGNAGVLGAGKVGVKGIGDVGVWATTVTDGIGIIGQAEMDPKGRQYTNWAAVFAGPVVILDGGSLTVAGPKSAAVPHPDGSHRLLYAMESPESWFEDFGEARLSEGRVEVPLDPEFAALVKTGSYHVFVTPYSDSNGLYVSKRTGKGFEVREQQGGTSNTRFSYRIIAKRKDIRADRLGKVTLPSLPQQTTQIPASPRRSTVPAPVATLRKKNKKGHQ